MIGELSTFSSDAYLTHHWPFDNGQLTDVIGGATMTQGLPGTSFTTDRFGNANCALNLNNGYTNVPAGYYFSTPQYSVSVWIHPASSIGQWSRLLDFTSALGQKNDEFGIILNQGSPGNNPSFQITTTSGSTNNVALHSTKAFTLSKWQLLVMTYDSTGLKAYINGSLLSLSGTLTYTPYRVLRSFNYVGKSCSSSDPYTLSYLDDLKFYNISLTSAQIMELVNEVATTSEKK